MSESVAVLSEKIKTLFNRMEANEVRQSEDRKLQVENRAMLAEILLKLNVLETKLRLYTVAVATVAAIIVSGAMRILL